MQLPKLNIKAPAIIVKFWKEALEYTPEILQHHARFKEYIPQLLWIVVGVVIYIPQLQQHFIVHQKIGKLIIFIKYTIEQIYIFY